MLFAKHFNIFTIAMFVNIDVLAFSLSPQIRTYRFFKWSCLWMFTKNWDCRRVCML